MTSGEPRVREEPGDREAGTRRRTRSPSTATIPPPISASRSTAKAMSRSDMPTTTADGRDEAVLDQHPSGRMLGSLVVAGDDPPAGEAGGSCLERDELEAVDVHEPAVGDLQVRDHRQRRGTTA